MYIAIVLFIGTQSIYAQQTNTYKEGVLSAPLSSELGVARARLLYKHTYYLSNTSKYFNGSEKPSQMSSVGMGLEMNSAGEQWAPQMDGEVFYSATESVPYINLEEAYLKKTISGVKYRWGRKKVKWSRFDEEWGTGLWQPRFRWDKVDPKSQGLIGLFGKNLVAKNFSMTWAVLPLTMPDISVSAQIRGRKIFSNNPWFRPPPAKVSINGRDRDLVSNINSPSASEVLFRPGFATKVEWLNNKTLYRASFAYKPSNFVYLSFPYVFKLYEDRSEAEVELNVNFMNHSVVSLEVFDESQLGELGVGLTVNWPHEKPLQKEWVYQGAYRATLGYLNYQPQRLPLQISYLKLIGGLGKDHGSITSSHGSLFEQRYMWQNAVSLTVDKSHLTFIKAWSLAATGNMLYDFDQKAGRVMSQLSLSRGGWDLKLTGMFIGIVDASAPKNEEGFARVYRANDLMEASVTYAY